eukprot:COSAG06_NODE_114_length_23375_cov_20.304219_22_plen_115_part_00
MCGGASALTILREIKYDPAIRSLTANPVEELAGLRTSSLANITTPLALGAGTTHEIPVGSNHTITMLLLIVLLSITHITCDASFETQDAYSDHIIKILKGGVKLNTTFIDDDSR